MRHILWAALFALIPLGAQQAPPAGTAAAPDSTPKFSSSTQLVIETVIVKDKSGNPVEGLTAKDFTITEDGKPQSIAFCEFQKLASPQETVPTFATRPGAEVVKVDKVTRGQIAPEAPGNIQHRDRRMLAMYFDMSAMPVPDQLRASSAAEKFIKTKMTPQDLLAIMKFSGSGVEVLDDFTDNRDELLTSIQKLVAGDAQGDPFDPNDDSSADTGHVPEGLHGQCVEIAEQQSDAEERHEQIGDEHPQRRMSRPRRDDREEDQGNGEHHPKGHACQPPHAVTPDETRIAERGAAKGDGKRREVQRELRPECVLHLKDLLDR